MRKGLGFHNRRSPFLVSSGPAPVAYWITSLNTYDPTVYALYSYTVNVDFSGNSYVVTQAFDNNLYVGYFIVEKYNSSGIIQWQKQLTDNDPNGGCGPNGGISDSSGNTYAIGTLNDSSAGYDGAIAKYNSSGVLQWQRGFGSPSPGFYEIFTSGAFDPSGNLYVLGYTDYWSAGATYDGMINKYNTSGALLGQWLLSDFASVAFTVPKTIGFDSAGNYYVTGTTTLPDPTRGLPMIVKFNSSNVLQWQIYLDDPVYTSGIQAQSSTTDSSGNTYVCGYAGYSLPGAGNYFTPFVVKINSSGVIQWQRYVAFGTDYRALLGIKLDSSNNVYVTGVDGSGASNVDIVFKYNSSGVLQWQRTLSQTSAALTANGITVDSSGNYYLAGNTLNDGYTYGSGLTVKLPTDGSKTGTYGSYTYAAASYTDSAGAMTADILYLAYSLNAFTSSASSMTDTVSAFTTTVTNV